ncbi:MAG TPA: helix-turn-helix transcriptional regulator [Trinickia sp.]|nr:helix-turn-helix transcriptional regulator [Trinickia sp.]
MSFIEQIKDLAQQRGMTVAALAPLVGMARQNLGASLSGRHDPKASTLDAVAAGLDAEWVLVPREQLAAVRQLLAGKGSGPDRTAKTAAELFAEKGP